MAEITEELTNDEEGYLLEEEYKRLAIEEVECEADDRLIHEGAARSEIFYYAAALMRRSL